MIDATEQIDQCALAAAARTDDGHAIAGHELEVDISQGADGAAIEDTAHPAQDNQRAGLGMLVRVKVTLDGEYYADPSLRAAPIGLPSPAQKCAAPAVRAST